MEVIKLCLNISGVNFEWAILHVSCTNTAEDILGLGVQFTATLADLPFAKAAD